jgi:two-component system response regulator PilR (NtrC family)
MRSIRQRIARVAPTDATVLVTGDVGVGKELVARAIHRGSARAALPFVGLTPDALADAVRDPDFGLEGRPGPVAAAGPGTLFLADVGEAAPASQAALLALLKERRFRRAGGGAGRAAGARIVMASTRDLAARVEAGGFRRDLFYCVSVFTIPVPPLNARRQDIAPLARHFVERFARETGRGLRGLSPAAERVLGAHAWPGNVAELENVVERAAVLEASDRVQAGSLELDDAPGPDRGPEPPPRGASAGAAGPSPPPVEALPESGFVLEKHVRDLERDYLARALHQAGGVKVRAAGLLGMTFRSFRYYAKKYDLG